jgi:hypothetical protein
MNNLKTYGDFINEGLFGSKYKHVVDKIYDYIMKMDPNNITPEPKTFFVDTIVFVIKKESNNRDVDPYGEEIWDDDVEIELSRTDFSYDYEYRLFINGDRVKTTNHEARKLYMAAVRRIKRKAQDEKDARVNKAIKNL